MPPSLVRCPRGGLTQIVSYRARRADGRLLIVPIIVGWLLAGAVDGARAAALAGAAAFALLH